MIEKLLPVVKKNCTTKFDESLDISFQINNKQKKNEINIVPSVQRTAAPTWKFEYGQWAWSAALRAAASNASALFTART